MNGDMLHTLVKGSMKHRNEPRSENNLSEMILSIYKGCAPVICWHPLYWSAGAKSIKMNTCSFQQKLGAGRGHRVLNPVGRDRKNLNFYSNIDVVSIGKKISVFFMLTLDSRFFSLINE